MVEMGCQLWQAAKYDMGLFDQNVVQPISLLLSIPGEINERFQLIDPQYAAMMLPMLSVEHAMLTTSSAMAAENAGAMVLRNMNGGGEVFDPVKLERMLAKLENKGVGIMRGEEADRLLAHIDAKAAYLPAEGGPGTLILPANPTRSMIAEEILHYTQYRNAGFPSSGTPAGVLQGLQFEVAAQSRLMNLARARNWNSAELQHFERASIEWSKLLEAARQKP